MLAPADATLDLIAAIERELAKIERVIASHVEHAEGECALVIGGAVENARRRIRERVYRMGVLV